MNNTRTFSLEVTVDTDDHDDNLTLAELEMVGGGAVMTNDD